MSILFSASNICTGYKNRPALLNDFSLSLEAGQILAVIGANGSGKSTLLRSFCGLQKPERGVIKIQGQDLYHLTPPMRARLVGALFSEAPRYSGLRVEEMVQVGRYPYSGLFGKLTAEDLEIVQAAMVQAGCENMANRNTAQLSDGELQKVMMARLLAQQTAVVILDEPANFLDPPSRVGLFKMLMSIAQYKVVIFSSHDIQMALNVASLVLLLDGEGGYIVANPGEIISHPAFLKFLPIEDMQQFFRKTGF